MIPYVRVFSVTSEGFSAPEWGLRSKSMTHQPGVYVPLRALFLVLEEQCQLLVNEHALSTGEVPIGGLHRNRVVR